jgi:hypothetical protein
LESERVLSECLRRAGIEPAATYTTGQVARILGVSAETVRRLVDAYEPTSLEAGGDAPRGDPPRPTGLRAVRINTHRRVPHDALVEWLHDNAAYLRLYGRGPD